MGNDREAADDLSRSNLLAHLASTWSRQDGPLALVALGDLREIPLMKNVSAKLDALHWARLKVFLTSSGQQKYWRQRVADLEAELAQGTEARRAETGAGSVHDGPVGNADAP